MHRWGSGKRSRALTALVVGVVAVGAALGHGSSASAAPANDDFPGKTITGLPFTETVNTTGATDQPDEPFCGTWMGGLTVWYNYTPPTDTVLMVDPGGSEYRVVISVYVGTSLTDLECIGTSSMGLDFEPIPRVIRATGGQTYYFQSGSMYYPFVTGNMTLNLRELTPPPNDDFPGKTITSLPFSETMDTTGASDEPDEPFCGFWLGWLTVWWHYTPAVDAVLMMDTAGSKYRTLVAAYEGASFEDLKCVGLSQLGFNLEPGPEVFKVKGGQTYYFQASSVDQPFRTGMLTLNLREVKPPPNDDFPGLAVTELPFTHTADTTTATLDEEGEPMLGPSVWYQFTPWVDGTFVAHTMGSNYDTGIFLLTSPPWLPRTNAECADLTDVLVFRADADQTVHFQLGSQQIPAQLGTLVFTVDEASPEALADPGSICPQAAPEPPPNPDPEPEPSPPPEDDQRPPAVLPITGGGPPPSGHPWSWIALLGGALATLAAATLAVALRRAQK